MIGHSVRNALLIGAILVATGCGGSSHHAKPTPPASHWTIGMTIVVPCNENMYAYPLRPGYNWTWGDGTSWNTPPMDGNADSAYLGDGRCRFTVLG